MRRLAIATLVIAALPTLAHADSTRVVKMAFGTGIDNHTITGVDTTFPADCGRLYFWTVTAGPMEADTIFHTWFRNGYQIQRTAIEVRGSFYRAHTFKTINARLAGSWEVTVSDRTGRLLAADSTTVRPAEPPEE